MRYILLLFTIFLGLLSKSQKNITVSGYVTDKKTTEKLAGASVFLNDKSRGTTSNSFGFYSLTLPPGNNNISYSFVGYKVKSLKLSLHKDTVIDIGFDTDLAIDEITVKARRMNPGRIESTETGTDMVSMENVKKTPVIGGESDILKTLQFLPGIKQSQEGTSGISVRGGSPDQNLILLDGVPVYNVSHLFGFLSVFNSDAISQVKMYKGGIPARYGGRLSSVLDISMKEGNIEDPYGTVSVSPISGSLTLEGPIKTDTASYIVSGRRTFLDLPVRLGLALTQPIQAGYYFYDFTAKANWKINPKNRVYFSSYFGKDRYFIRNKEGQSKTDYSYNWGNITTVLRWNSILNRKLFTNVTGYYSNFYNRQNIDLKDDENKFKYNIGSALNDFAVAADFDYYPSSSHSIKYGLKGSIQSFSPQYIVLKSSDTDTTFGKGISTKALVSSLYAEDDMVITRRLGANFGFRVDNYSTGSKNYNCFQPRVSVRYLLSNRLSVKASYSKMAQFLHLLSNNSVGLPTDLWVSSTEKVKPQNSWISSLGVFFEPFSGIEFSVDGYLKKMQNIIRFDEGASFIASRQRSWEDNVIVGNGKAYGTEFLVKKDAGKLTGWIGYALSWAENQFAEINRGEPFPYRYDKRHDFSFLGQYKIYDDGIDSKSFSFAFTYNTGYAVSIPDIKHQGMNILTENGSDGWLGMFDALKTRVTYETPNNYRMPDFHHLDIGYHSTRKLTEYSERTWSFSIYNVYNRLNPWYYYKKDDKMRQVSLFPIIPSVSFTYKW